MNIESCKENILKKEQENEEIIKRLCQDLSDDFCEVLGFNPQFKYYGGIKDDKYRIYGCRYSSGIMLNSPCIEFNFKCAYLRTEDVLSHKDYFSKLTDEELVYKADNIRDINYIDIEYVGVCPHGQGIGTELINMFLKRVKRIKKIKKIYLMSASIEARNFWSKMGFEYIDDNMELADNINAYMCGANMVLYLNNIHKFKVTIAKKVKANILSIKNKIKKIYK